MVGPHVAFTGFERRRQVYGVCGAHEEIAGSRHDQRTCPPQQGFAGRNQLPQPVLYVAGKARRRITCVTVRGRARVQAAVKHGVKFRESP